MIIAEPKMGFCMKSVCGPHVFFTKRSPTSPITDRTWPVSYTILRVPRHVAARDWFRFNFFLIRLKKKKNLETQNGFHPIIMLLCVGKKVVFFANI